jgi:hypothetical protein
MRTTVTFSITHTFAYVQRDEDRGTERERAREREEEKENRKRGKRIRYIEAGNKAETRKTIPIEKEKQLSREKCPSVCDYTCVCNSRPFVRSGDSA